MAAGDGLVSMTPTSIAHSGTSASINVDGGVDFTAVTELSLNGVFTSDYDNYFISYGPIVATSGYQAVSIRLRASGTDESGSNYALQTLYVSGSTTLGGRSTGQTSASLLSADDSNRGGASIHIYGPALAQPTAMRSLQVIGDSGADLYDLVATHSLSTAYDGITFTIQSSDMTGTIHVFGYEE